MEFTGSSGGAWGCLRRVVGVDHGGDEVGDVEGLSEREGMLGVARGVVGSLMRCSWCRRLDWGGEELEGRRKGEFGRRGGRLPDSGDSLGDLPRARRVKWGGKGGIRGPSYSRSRRKGAVGGMEARTVLRAIGMGELWCGAGAPRGRDDGGDDSGGLGDDKTGRAAPPGSRGAGATSGRRAWRWCARVHEVQHADGSGCKRLWLAAWATQPGRGRRQGSRWRR